MPNYQAYNFEDFSTALVWKSGLQLRLREICPKDYYFIQLMTNDYPEQVDSPIFAAQLLERLSIDDELWENFLAHATKEEMEEVVEWLLKERLQSKSMTLEHWLRLAYGLLGGEWRSDLDWLEQQPIPKILTMASIAESAHGQK